MSKKLFYICNIVVEDDEDYKIISEYFGAYPVEILRALPDEFYFDLPTCIVGWNTTKHKFPKQNIFNKDILPNLTWSFSKSEKEQEFSNNLETFFYDSLKKSLPQKFELYDSYLNRESLPDFLESKINKNKNVFLYASEGALYFFNDGNNFIVNVKSLCLTEKSFKLLLTAFVNAHKIVCLSFSNLDGYVDLDLIGEVISFETLRWVKYGIETPGDYFQIIPNFKFDKYIPFLMGKHSSMSLDYEEQKFYTRMCEKEKITCWLSSREIALSLDVDKDLQYKIRRDYKLAKINYSNKRTITGRIVAHDIYNPQNLDKSNDDRKKIISRFTDGKILVLDYISFETKISLYLCDDEDFIEKYYNTDLHFETASVIFDTPDVEIHQRQFAKLLNHALLYGAGEDTLLLKLAFLENPQYKLSQIKKLLKPIIDKSNEIKDQFKANGYLITPWGSIIRTDKVHASFNNYIQSYATEIVVDKIIALKKLLRPYKTQFMFQVHDSLVLDLHPSEQFLLEPIIDLLTHHTNMLFSVDYRMGSNYKEVA